MKLTIVMYHYVRDVERSRYPRINALSIGDFRQQLDYLNRHYSVVAADDVVRAACNQDKLPPNAAWLTFDDGYLDHYTTVFPLLHERGWQGSFFAPARAVLQGKLLDVNKIHMILASAASVASIVDVIQQRVTVAEDRLEIGFPELWKKNAIASRLDSADVRFVKNVLQHSLPPDFRAQIVDELFARFVTADETAIAAELYISLDQIRLMQQCGMHFGSHGYGHLWMNRLSKADQEREVELSIEFLKTIGAPTEEWIMCYPYGGWNPSLSDILRSNGCALGLTTRQAIADLSKHGLFELPRIDTCNLVN